MCGSLSLICFLIRRCVRVKVGTFKRGGEERERQRQRQTDRQTDTGR